MPCHAMIVSNWSASSARPLAQRGSLSAHHAIKPWNLQRSRSSRSTTLFKFVTNASKAKSKVTRSYVIISAKDASNIILGAIYATTRTSNRWNKYWTILKQDAPASMLNAIRVTIKVLTEVIRITAAWSITMLWSGAITSKSWLWGSKRDPQDASIQDPHTQFRRRCKMNKWWMSFKINNKASTSSNRNCRSKL